MSTNTVNKNTKDVRENTHYYEGTGRRKEATARVRLYPHKKREFLINEEKGVEDYFSVREYREISHQPLEKVSPDQNFLISAHISGGGPKAQAEALRHGISRALVIYDENNRSLLKKEGFLKRDPRGKERKKFGLRKARKRAQWSKR